MHELSYAEGIIRVVRAQQKEQPFQRVLEIQLGIGEYTGIVTDCLSEFFPYAAKDTPAEGAVLTYQTIKGEFHCKSCGTTGPADRKHACCAACGSTDLVMTAGREFQILSLRVE